MFLHGTKHYRLRQVDIQVVKKNSNTDTTGYNVVLKLVILTAIESFIHSHGDFVNLITSLIKTAYKIISG